MWYAAEYDHVPGVLDSESSAKYVYVRKDIKEVEKEDSTVWECLEQKILKTDWETYQTIITNSDGIDGLGELADTNSTAIDDIGELLAAYDERITALENKEE